MLSHRHDLHTEIYKGISVKISQRVSELLGREDLYTEVYKQAQFRKNCR